MELYDSSRQLKSKSNSEWSRKGGVANRIKFDEIPIGKSVIIQVSEIKETSLRVLVSTASKKFNKRFRCLKHKEFTDENGFHPAVFEVGRIPDIVELVQQWDSSPQMNGE